MEKFYSVQEVASNLSMCDDKIRTKIRKGEFPGTIKNGRDFRIPESAIDSYLTANTVIPPKPFNLRKPKRQKPSATFERLTMAIFDKEVAV